MSLVYYINCKPTEKTEAQTVAARIGIEIEFGTAFGWRAFTDEEGQPQVAHDVLRGELVAILGPEDKKSTFLYGWCHTD